MSHHMKREGFVRNVVFGVEDSLVSTVGFVSGIASASVPRETILLSGVVLVAVEAFSMAAGSFLSDASTREAMHRGHHHRVALLPSVAGGFVMLLSYMLSGLFVLVPYLLAPPPQALWCSVALSLLALALLGTYSARTSRLSALPRIVRMCTVGGIAIALGMVVARLF
jgi:VIT1/CCC1 family predicted Fe2+/Mn2+ transporter